MTPGARLFGRNANDEIVWSNTDSDIQEQFRESVRNDFPIVKQFVRTYGDPFESPNFEVIGEALLLLYPDANKELTAPQFADAIGTVLHGAADRLTVKAQPSAPAPQDARQRDKNGRFLSESQQRWSEYRQFSESHSSQECRDRARVDAGFASFLRTNLQREMSVEIGDAAQNLNAAPSKPETKHLSEDLIEFAECFRSLSFAEVRSLRTAASNPYGYLDFSQKLNRAIEAGLI